MIINVDELIAWYISINLMATIFMIFFVIPISNMIEELFKSIKVKHLFLTPVILLFLPWFLLIAIVYLLVNWDEYFGKNEFLNKDLITFKRGEKKNNGC